jgi:DNA recombination protein RmuC
MQIAFDLVVVVLLVVLIISFWLRRGAAGAGDDSGQRMLDRLSAAESALRGEFSTSRLEMGASTQAMRSEVVSLFQNLGEDARQRFSEMSAAQAERLATIDANLVEGRKEAQAASQSLREEVLRAFQSLSDTVRANLSQMAQTQQNQFDAFAQTLQSHREGSEHSARALREELQAMLARLGDGQAVQFTALAQQQGERLELMAKQVAELTARTDQRFEELRASLVESLDKIRGENEAKLEQMRLTVDEKLQGTLEARLGDSFRLVSERLELVHKGLGEMQTLATGVGDLKRVLTNVKSRGTWGEVQLSMLLEDMLTRDQYETNVRIRPDSGETVEFAVKMPGRNGEDVVYLPIDAKFPQEDYERLIAAQETASAEAIEKAGAALERAIRAQAKAICERYVHPPHSTDCAIMYLPTEGLFAEVLRRPGLQSELQSKHRVMVTGPTTLAALLTSLQMGFRTLAIEKRSSEVWQVLAAAKAEFRKYGDVWDKLGKQLDTARKTVDEAGKRTRAVEKKLRDVEVLDSQSVDLLLDGPDPLTDQGEDDAEAA